MRFNGALASAFFTSAVFFGHVAAHEGHDHDEEASSSSVVESSTSSAVERPTFTVSCLYRQCVVVADLCFLPRNHADAIGSLLKSMHLSMSNLQTTGKRDGNHHMPRKRTPRPTRIGRMLVNGPLKSPTSSPVS